MTIPYLCSFLHTQDSTINTTIAHQYIATIPCNCSYDHCCTASVTNFTKNIENVKNSALNTENTTILPYLIGYQVIGSHNFFRYCMVVRSMIIHLCKSKQVLVSTLYKNSIIPLRYLCFFFGLVDCYR